MLQFRISPRVAAVIAERLKEEAYEVLSDSDRWHEALATGVAEVIGIENAQKIQQADTYLPWPEVFELEIIIKPLSNKTYIARTE